MKRVLATLALVTASCAHAPPPRTAAPVVAPTAAPVVGPERLHGPVRTVALTGGTPADYTRMQGLFNTLVGQPLDRTRLRELLDQAMAPQTLADIDVHGEQLADGVKLAIAMRAQPTVLAVAVHESAGKYVPMDGFGASVGAPLAPGDVDQALVALRDHFHELGNARFTGSWHTVARPTGVDLVIDASVGETLVVASHAFHGNTHAKTADLEHALGGEVALGSPWQPDHVDHAVLLVNAYYFDHGYVQAVVAAPPLPLANPAVMTFEIKEGNQFHVGTFEIAGLSPTDLRAVRAVVKLKPGAVFSRSDMVAAMSAIHDKLVAAHPHVTVEPDTKLDPVSHAIATTLRVTLDAGN